MTITVESLEEFFSPEARAELQDRIYRIGAEADKLVPRGRRYLMKVIDAEQHGKLRAEAATLQDILTLAKDILYLVGELKEIEG